MNEVPEVRVAWCAGLVVVLVTVCARTSTPLPAADSVIAVVLGLSGPAIAPRHIPLLGLTGWAFLTGFVEHAGGALTFGAADLTRLGVLVVVPLAVSTVPRTYRGTRTSSRPCTTDIRSSLPGPIESPSS